MVVTLAHVYGMSLTWTNARQLIQSIIKAAGWVMLGEMVTHLAASLFKGLTFGTGTVLTALPQGAAAGYGSYIVGQAAKYYFEHGASWGGEAPKAVVTPNSRSHGQAIGAGATQERDQRQAAAESLRQGKPLAHTVNPAPADRGRLLAAGRA